MSWWRQTPQPGISLGTVQGRWWHRRVSLPLTLARTHWHAIGLSGSGKSTFLAHLYLSLLEQGQAATLIDPHGDLARSVFEQLVARGWYRSPEQHAKVRYVDFPAAEDAGAFLPFNVLAGSDPPHRLVANVVDALHRAFPETAEQPIFNVLMPKVARVLLDNQRPLTEAQRLLVDKPFRNALLAQSTSAMQAFFMQEYDTLKSWEQVTYRGSVNRRLDQFTSLPILEHSLGQTTNALDFRTILDTQTSLLISLGGVEPDARRLLGSLIMVAAEQAALSRARQPHRPRAAHWLLIDEFADFSAKTEEALTTMLSQTRKFGLFLVLAHQNFTQTSEKLRGALQNCGVELAFALGRDDAKRAAPTLGRVDPRTVRQATSDEASESAGMQEQWERTIQTLEDLAPGQAFFYRRGQPVVQLTTPYLSPPALDPTHLAVVEEVQRASLFRSSGTPASLAPLPAPVVSPTVRRRRLLPVD